MAMQDLRHVMLVEDAFSRVTRSRDHSSRTYRACSAEPGPSRCYSNIGSVTLEAPEFDTKLTERNSARHLL